MHHGKQCVRVCARAARVFVYVPYTSVCLYPQCMFEYVSVLVCAGVVACVFQICMCVRVSRRAHSSRVCATSVLWHMRLDNYSELKHLTPA